MSSSYNYIPVDPSERNIYFNLWKSADVDNTGEIGGGKAVSVLLRSGLEITILREIWSICTNTATMNELQFYNALRLISMVQHGEPIISQEALEITRDINYGPPIFRDGRFDDMRSVESDQRSGLVPPPAQIVAPPSPIVGGEYITSHHQLRMEKMQRQQGSARITSASYHNSADALAQQGQIAMNGQPVAPQGNPSPNTPNKQMKRFFPESGPDLAALSSTQVVMQQSTQSMVTSVSYNTPSALSPRSQASLEGNKLYGIADADVANQPHLQHVPSRSPRSMLMSPGSGVKYESPAQIKAREEIPSDLVLERRAKLEAAAKAEAEARAKHIAETERRAMMRAQSIRSVVSANSAARKWAGKTQKSIASQSQPDIRSLSPLHMESQKSSSSHHSHHHSHSHVKTSDVAVGPDTQIDAEFNGEAKSPHHVHRHHSHHHITTVTSTVISGEGGGTEISSLARPVTPPPDNSFGARSGVSKTVTEIVTVAVAGAEHSSNHHSSGHQDSSPHTPHSSHTHHHHPHHHPHHHHHRHEFPEDEALHKLLEETLTRRATAAKTNLDEFIRSAGSVPLPLKGPYTSHVQISAISTRLPLAEEQLLLKQYSEKESLSSESKSEGDASNLLAKARLRKQQEEIDRAKGGVLERRQLVSSASYRVVPTGQPPSQHAQVVTSNSAFAVISSGSSPDLKADNFDRLLATHGINATFRIVVRDGELRSKRVVLRSELRSIILNIEPINNSVSSNVSEGSEGFDNMAINLHDVSSIFGGRGNYLNWANLNDELMICIKVKDKLEVNFEVDGAGIRDTVLAGLQGLVTRRKKISVASIQ